MNREPSSSNVAFRNRIDAAELEVIQKFLNEPPVQIGAMASALGLEVKLAVLPARISGEIRPSDSASAGFKIRINRHENKVRQRFTIAHEIAHYLLHRQHIKDGLSDNVLYRSTLSNTLEQEANRLAASLLLPDSLIKAELEYFGNYISDDVASQLAKKFEVSRSAMEIKLGI